MSKRGGYTEAELLAAEWSKQRKKEAENMLSNPGTTSRRDREGNGGRSERHSYNKPEKHEMMDRRRAVRSRSRSRHRSRSRSPYSRSSTTYTSTDARDGDRKHRKELCVDEFGRTVEPGRVIAKAREDKPFRSRSRSRSRSASRDRRSNRSQGSWRHDKFDSRESSPVRERREVPRDYRPPSPTWVSKAGGVAIIRKKLDA